MMKVSGSSGRTGGIRYIYRHEDIPAQKRTKIFFILIYGRKMDKKTRYDRI